MWLGRTPIICSGKPLIHVLHISSEHAFVVSKLKSGFTMIFSVLTKRTVDVRVVRLEQMSCLLFSLLLKTGSALNSAAVTLILFQVGLENFENQR